MTQNYTTEDLFELLSELEEELGKFPRPNDVKRDERTPTVVTFYRRFDNDWEWMKTEYETWDDTGEFSDKLDEYLENQEKLRQFRNNLT